MARRILVIAVWIVALAAATTAVGMQVRSRRLADPARVLRPYLPRVPADLAARATLVERSRDAGGLALQYAIAGTPAEISAFAAAQGMQPSEGSIIGLAADRWTASVPGRPEVVVQLLATAAGPALLTVLDPRPGE